MKRLLVLMLSFSLLLASVASAQTADELVRKSQNAFLYAGNDFKARVLMRLVSKGGQERLREMVMLRKNFGAPGGEQKYFMYFYQPADVKDMTFMVHKHPGSDADRWLFVPAVNMVRRIAAKDKSSSFVGSDFTYEDVSGRNPEDDTHEAVRDEKIGSKDCAVVKSTPKTEDMEYSYKLSWIDKANFLPLKEEYYDKRNELARVFTADAVEVINDIPTITKRSMKNIQSGHMTEVNFTKAEYNIGIDETLFSERFLKQPPRKFVE